MQLSVKGKQLDVGDALRAHVKDSLTRILGKYFGDAIEVGVTLSREGHSFRAQLMAHVGRGIQLRAHGEAEEPYPAFDSAAEHLAKRLRRHKRRLRDHRNEDAADAETVMARQYVLAGRSFDETDEEDTTESGNTPLVAGGATVDMNSAVVIAEMATEIPSLTVEQAVMRMDLADLPALMFRNSSHSGLNMVYRRADGHIGWVDPRGNQTQ